MALTAADRDDFLCIIKIDPLDLGKLTQHLSRERTRQVLLEHAEKSYALFGFAVGIDDRFLDERLEPPFAERPMSGHVSVDGLGCGLMAEGRRPAVWCQLPDQALRVGGDAQQDIFEVLIRRNVDQLTALHERIQERRASRAFETSSKQPILPAEGDDAELVFGAIVIDREPPIVDKALQRRPLIGEIADRVAQR
jgi:hypothetical protein